MIQRSVSELRDLITKAEGTHSEQEWDPGYSDATVWKNYVGPLTRAIWDELPSIAKMTIAVDALAFADRYAEDMK